MAAIALPTDDVCGATQAGYYRYIVGPARVKGTKIGGNCRAQETSFEPPPAWPGWNCRQQPARTTPRTPRLNRGPVLPARIMQPFRHIGGTLLAGRTSGLLRVGSP